MSKIKFLLVFLLLAVIPTAFAADLNVSVGTLQATHGVANAGSFILQNLNATYNMSGINCSISVPVGWTGSVTNCPTYLGVSSSSTVSYTVTVPQFTVTGLNSVTITAEGMENGTMLVSTPQTFNVNVTNSPALTLTWISSPQDVYQLYNTTAVVNVNNTGNVDFSAVSINVTGYNATFSATPIALARGVSNLWTLILNTTKDTNYGSNAVTVTAIGLGTPSTVNTTASSSASFNVLNRYCSVNSSTDRITISEITNDEDISGEEFDPLDRIDVDVDVENSYDEDRTVVVSAVLVFENKRLDDTESEKIIDINDDDSESVTLNLTIPADSKEGTYYIYVKAYDDDSTKYCDYEVISFTVAKSSAHKLLPYELSVEPSNVSCEGVFTVKGKLANIGSYDEDQVKLVYSDRWTSMEKYYDNLDEGDEVEFEFSSAVPKNATEGIRSFTLGMYFNYDSDDEDYKKSESKTFSLFSVYGNCVKESKNVSISTDLATTQVFTSAQSEVRVLVTNTGTLKQTYTIDVSTLSWATLGSVSPASFELEPGSARYVSIKLTPNVNVTGIQSMDVKVSYAGASQTKTLSFNVQKVSDVSSFIDRIGFSISRDWIWYGIGVVVAMIIIMIFAISSASTKAAAVKAAMTQTKIKQYKNY